MANLMLRGCDEELSSVLKETSKRRGISVNRLILDTLQESFIGKGKKIRRYDDLDALAGTWSAAEAAEFDSAAADFDKVDGELWGGK